MHIHLVLRLFRTGSRLVLPVLVLLAFGCRVEAATSAADAVYTGGVIYTIDAHGTVAQALAVTHGHIAYVGSDQGARKFVGPNTRVVDLKGHMVMPGLIDGHMHPVSGGLGLLKCSLNYASLTVAEFQSRIQACLDQQPSARPDAWLEVVSWFRYGIQPKDAVITRATLDALKTNRPIIVRDSFGHSSLANSRALALAKITAQTPDPVAGRIARDGSGEPTGILEDGAQDLVGQLIPKPTAAVRIAAARAALDAMRRQGITAFLDAVGEPPDIEAFAAVEKAGGLTARAHFAPLIRSDQTPDVPSARQAVARVLSVARQYDQGPLRPRPSISVHNAKLFMDGVITAPADTGALLEPYYENHGTAEHPDFEPARTKPAVYFPAPILREILIGLGQAGIDPHLHTDGDGAVRAALDGVAQLRQALPGRDIRPGLAHCELVDPADYPRFAQLNAIPVLSFQWEKPAFDTVEGARDSLGPHRYPLIEPSGVLAAQGARIAYGSDWPVDPLDEWFALQVGVTRMGRPGGPPQHSGRLGDGPALTQAAVLRAITANAAYELHEERFIGSLEAGKLADFIVLDRNVATVSPSEISATHVLRTVVGGQVVYEQ
jgi:predicted amidohydrolase YtcJ